MPGKIGLDGDAGGGSRGKFGKFGKGGKFGKVGNAGSCGRGGMFSDGRGEDRDMSSETSRFEDPSTLGL